MRGALALFVTLYLLHALIAEANNLLSGAHVWLFAGGLYVAYSALMLPFRQGLAATILGGLLCDSLAPVAFGTHAALFATAHLVVYGVRERLQRDGTAVRVAVSLLVNLAFFLALTSARLRLVPATAAVLPRMLSDLAWSEAALALIAPWFFALQVRTLELARAQPARIA
jgi:rod shape-determining protein MreD